MNKFEKLGLSEELLKSINELGFEKPTPIQENIIPVILEGYDVIGQAQTGTGKTLAFSSILLTNLKERKKKPQAYILSPTRELTMQIHEELKKLGKYSSLRFACVYGGSGIEKQIKSIKKGVDIVVGTPGRMMDLMRRKVLQLDEVSYVVLDEADEMLNMGFVEDIETIISKTNPDHTTMLFSATMPEGIKKIAKKYMKPDYKHIQVKQKTITANTVKQYYFEVKQKDRFETLCRIIDSETVQSGIIFCRTKRSVDEVTEQMQKANYNVEAMHGDLNQDHRMRTLKKFNEGTIHYLIATDVAARGIDVENISHVINYELPQEVDLYVHRIGRTGRAGRKGRSFTLVVGREIYRIRDIERICNTQIKPRMVPSVADITQAKASQIFDQVMEVISNNDLSSLQKKVEDKIEEENITAMELCAGFLKLHLGDDMEEIPAENYIEEMRKKRAERKGGRSGRRDDRRGDDDRREGKGRRRRQTDEDVLDMMREHRPGKRKSDKAFDKKSDKKSDKKFEKKGSDRKRSDKSEKKSKGLFGKERTFKKNDIDKKTGKAKKWK